MTTRSEQRASNHIAEQYGRLISTSLPCDGVSLTAFLQQASGQARFYWESNRDHVAFAGFGPALELIAYGSGRFGQIQQQAHELFDSAVVLEEREELAAPRLFGGFSFRDDFIPDNTWSDFTPAHFVLPHYQLVSIDGAMWMTINAQIPLDEDPYLLLPELKQALQTRIDLLREQDARYSFEPMHPTDLRYPMSFEDWRGIIENATARMRQGELNKVVLSRMAELRFAERVNVDAALRYLADHYAECYRFLFEPRPYHAFYGATPELLAGVNGDQLHTMALAGSIGRGKDARQDAALAAELMASRKDRYEHQLVIDRMVERLQPIVDQLELGETGIYALSNIQHIHTPFVGRLRQPAGILPVVEALHPTPALGGDPRDVAMKIISESEPVPRGWFGAPVGWVDRKLDGQFGVAIRSAVAQDHRVWLYAGAGIVADSEAQKEWDETALKFRPMLNALGIQELRA